MRKVALLGYGHWGKILLPHLRKHFDVVCIYGRSIKEHGIFVNRLETALASEAEAAVIATPISTHYGIAGAALLSGKHVFCEKPLAKTPRFAHKLADLAAFRRLHLVTDYTYTFSKRLQVAQITMAKGQPHKISLTLERNLKNEENVFWVLASHLLAILGMFADLSQLKFKKDLVSTRERGAIYFNGKIEGGIFVDMTAPKKKTEIILCTDVDTLIFNDLLQDDNLGYAVEYFRDVLDGKEDERANLDLALSVTSVLFRLQLN